MMAACVGVTERGAGDDAAARHALEIARAWAERFDADPCYDVTGIRFVNMSERATSYDDMGATATEAIEKVIDEQKDERLSALWKETKQA